MVVTMYNVNGGPRAENIINTLYYRVVWWQGVGRGGCLPEGGMGEVC